MGQMGEALMLELTLAFCDCFHEGFHVEPRDTLPQPAVQVPFCSPHTCAKTPGESEGKEGQPNAGLLYPLNMNGSLKKRSPVMRGDDNGEVVVFLQR